MTGMADSLNGMGLGNRKVQAALNGDSKAACTLADYRLRDKISTPTWPAAISRNAVTVGLSWRISSTKGDVPFSSWRARRAAARVKSKWLGMCGVQSSTVMRAIMFP